MCTVEMVGLSALDTGDNCSTIQVLKHLADTPAPFRRASPITPAHIALSPALAISCENDDPLISSDSDHKSPDSDRKSEIDWIGRNRPAKRRDPQSFTYSAIEIANYNKREAEREMRAEIATYPQEVTKYIARTQTKQAPTKQVPAKQTQAKQTRAKQAPVMSTTYCFYSPRVMGLGTGINAMPVY